MGIVGAIALVLFAITAVLIITIVLLQDEQGEGFGGLFGGGGSTTPFGAAGGNVLIRITSILGVFFMVSSLAVAMAYKSGEKDDVLGEARRVEESGPDWFLEQPLEDENQN